MSKGKSIDTPEIKKLKEEKNKKESKGFFKW